MIAILSAALVAAFLSGTVYMRLSPKPVAYEGVEPGWSYMHVMVRGWPVPFIYDKIGLSPGNSADWVGVLVGVDAFRPGAFLLDVAIYAVVFAVMWRAGRRARPRSSTSMSS